MQQTEEGTKTRKPLLTTECIMGSSDDLFKTVNTDMDSQSKVTNKSGEIHAKILHQLCSKYGALKQV